MPNSSCNDGRDELHLSVDWIEIMMSYIAFSIASGLAGIAIYVYFMRQGQFEESEEIKYQLFREEEEKK
jgi:hypothetical protein